MDFDLYWYLDNVKGVKSLWYMCHYPWVSE